jgi:hypothetical protein
MPITTFLKFRLVVFSDTQLTCIASAVVSETEVIRLYTAKLGVTIICYGRALGGLWVTLHSSFNVGHAPAYMERFNLSYPDYAYTSILSDNNYHVIA